LIEPLRMSPAANTPAMLASKGYGKPRKSFPDVPLDHGAVYLPPRQDETAFVEFDGTLEPACVGLRPDEDEKRPLSRHSVALLLRHLELLLRSLPRRSYQGFGGPSCIAPPAADRGYARGASESRWLR
jgi:hypothetical protein